MANQEQLDRLLKQDVYTWNHWRSEHLEIHLDLKDANLKDANLRAANLRAANLRDANLRDANLRDANLRDANLRDADLRGADLSYADLTRASLTHANLDTANLSYADLNEARVGYTSFGDVNLSVVKNLEMVVQLAPSTIGIDTIYRSGGNIPEVFLRGAGVPDSFLDFMRSLVGSPIDYYSCFISYSSKDDAFAERLYADLQSKGVRCWYAPHDMRIADEIRPRIDESIRVRDKLLLVLSESSLASTWVKKEVETAFEYEAQQNKLVLFPIRLDETVMHTQEAWAADIRRMRHIGDFTRWKDHEEYQKVFERLLRDLQA
jgi:TIR domain-containing protein/pentapeptide repeat protein